MKINSQLKRIRDSYLKIEPASDFKKYGWLALRKEIEATDRRKSSRLTLFARNIVFAVITIILLGGGLAGLVKAAQSSLPGDTLYPLKRLSESVIVAVSGDKQIRLEKRAEEVVGAAEQKSGPTVLKETVKEYQKAVSETKQEVKKSGNKEQFQAKLKKQEEKFQAVSEQQPASRETLKEAIEATKIDGEDKIKGVEHKDASKTEEIGPVKKDIEEIIKK